MHSAHANIYTDGSCHTQHRIGAWAALIFIGEETITFSGTATDTTHNRMELMAVIKAIEYIQKEYLNITAVTVYSDSQYVVGLAGREAKLSTKKFITNKGNEIQNADLVKTLLALNASSNIKFVKVKAHQKKSDAPNYNIEVDKLSRKLVRDEVIKLI